jgi:hypothetical protein
VIRTCAEAEVATRDGIKGVVFEDSVEAQPSGLVGGVVVYQEAAATSVVEFRPMLVADAARGHRRGFGDLLHLLGRQVQGWTICLVLFMEEGRLQLHGQVTPRWITP